MKHIVGYCDRWSVAPGERIAFKVSAVNGGDYEARLQRVICGDDTPGGPGLDLRDVAGQPPWRLTGRAQPLVTGSYLRMARPASVMPMSSVTVASWVWPTRIGPATQCILAHQQGRRGFSLAIDPGGYLVLTVGDGTRSETAVSELRLTERCWYYAWASYDADCGEAWIGVHRLRHGSADASSGARAVALSRHLLGMAEGDLLIGAGHDAQGTIGAHFNGKLDSPRLAAGAMQPIAAIEFGERPASCPWSDDVVGCWDFADAMQSIAITDRSGSGWHGYSVNLPARAVTGRRWSGDVHDWRFAPQHYTAIHFHDDDLYDAGWQTDFEFLVPSDLVSGYYVMRLTAADDVSYVSFFVRPPRDRATSRLAFLASTATYLAYANYRFMLDQSESESQLAFPIVLEREQVYLQQHPELGLSTYDRHADGSGVRHSSRLRPILNMGPCTDVWNLNADTHLLRWLDSIGESCDIITDEDLHAEGASLLERYRCVMTGTHPEYLTTEMRQGIESWLERGGRLMYLGGNGFYWRIAFHKELPGVMEVRRAEGGARYWAEQPGESGMGFSGEYGGLWRRIGAPSESLVGVGTRAIAFDRATWYARTAASHDPRVRFMFEGVADDARIGDFGSLGGGAAGSEVDASNPSLGTPTHALVVGVATEFGSGAMPVPEDVLMLTPASGADFNAAVRAEIVFFETTGGGAVFSTGSVCWAASLAHQGGDNNVARITGNVLRRFLAADTFPSPSAVP
jgi:N,N-dimethylformamidase